MSKLWLTVLMLFFSPIVLAAMEDAEKISEIKGRGESLWGFLERLPSSFEAQIFYAVVLFGVIGMFINYAQRWMKKEISGSLINYLFCENIRGTMLSISTTIGVGVGAITGGIFETGSGEFVGWFNVMWVSLMNGFMWDSALNKGQRPVWTEEQRAAAVTPEVKP